MKKIKSFIYKLMRMIQIRFFEKEYAKDIFDELLFSNIKVCRFFKDQADGERCHPERSGAGAERSRGIWLPAEQLFLRSLHFASALAFAPVEMTAQGDCFVLLDCIRGVDS